MTEDCGAAAPAASRRAVLGAIAAGPLAVAGRVAAAPAEPVAQTRFGRVRGRLENGVYAFRGIRYGASTAGENRFRPPRAPAPWAGIADALAFGAMAPQSSPAGAPKSSRIILGRLARPAGAPTPVHASESEDCLFLNVWTTGLADGRRRPVMVWLHGGFFSGGSGALDGAPLARNGEAVVVSVNHRLNVFGFGHLADLGGADWARSGNAGMLDVVAALRWVADNIEAFGGDPRRVMVFGESGGGMKTSFLMASPTARGLFSRAGIQSGPGLAMMTREGATRVSEMLLSELGLKTAQLGELRTLPAERLLAARYAVEGKLGVGAFTELRSFAPMLDPVDLPAQPFSAAALPLSAHIPLLIGWNRDEMSFFMGEDEAGFALDEPALAGRLQARLGAAGDEVNALYRSRYPAESPSQRYIRIYSDVSIMAPTLQLAERKAAAGGAAVHVYRFDWRSPALGGELGALHTLEQPFVFDTTDASPLAGGGDGARRLGHRMSAAWAAFAADGAPSAGAGLPAWAAYEPGARLTMLLDDSCRLAPDPTGPELALWRRLDRPYAFPLDSFARAPERGG